MSYATKYALADATDRIKELTLMQESQQRQIKLLRHQCKILFDMMSHLHGLDK